MLSNFGNHSWAGTPQQRAAVCDDSTARGVVIENDFPGAQDRRVPWLRVGAAVTTNEAVPFSQPESRILTFMAEYTRYTTMIIVETGSPGGYACVPPAYSQTISWSRAATLLPALQLAMDGTSTRVGACSVMRWEGERMGSFADYAADGLSVPSVVSFSVFSSQREHFDNPAWRRCAQGRIPSTPKELATALFRGVHYLPKIVRATDNIVLPE
jgi:hypothetical protein